VSWLVLAVLSAAAGAPSPSLRVEGPCATALVQSLKRERPGAAVDQGLATPGDLRVHIRSKPQPWHVEVSGIDGETRLRRSLSARSCPEAADAAAVIVERFLVSIAWQGGDAQVEPVGWPERVALKPASEEGAPADAAPRGAGTAPVRPAGPTAQGLAQASSAPAPSAAHSSTQGSGPAPGPSSEPVASGVEGQGPNRVAEVERPAHSSPEPRAPGTPAAPGTSAVPVAQAIPGAVAPGGEVSTPPVGVERPVESGPGSRWLSGAEVSVGGAAALGNVGVVPAASLEAAVRVREVVRASVWIGGAGSESQDVVVTYPGAPAPQVQGQVVTREGFAYGTASLCTKLSRLEGCAGLAGGTAFSYATASGQLYQKQHAVLAPPVAAAIARLAYRWAAGPEVGLQMLGGVALTKPSLVVDSSSFYTSRFEWVGALHAGWVFP
jgi:hypothetical protein